MTELSKIAISGKGGVGKTTLSALLAHIYAEQGRSVIAIDGDPAGGLAQALGLPFDLDAQVTPVAAQAQSPVVPGVSSASTPAWTIFPIVSVFPIEGYAFSGWAPSNLGGAAVSALRVRCSRLWSRICCSIVTRC